jgi:hypothetical protein
MSNEFSFKTFKINCNNMKKIYGFLGIALCFLFNGMALDVGANENKFTVGDVPDIIAQSGNNTILEQMSGIYYVGQGYSSPNFATITEAFLNLNSRGVNGAVYLILKNPSSVPYNTTNGETFPLSLDTIIGASSTNTITMKPDAGLTPIIMGSSTSSIIKLSGSDYFTIDGSNSGGTDRSLSIENTNTSTNSGTIWLSGTATGMGATYNTIKNCIIKTGMYSIGSYGIILCGSSFTGVGYDNDNNTIQNNYICKAYYGIYSNGCLASTSDSLKVVDNIIGDTLGNTSNYVWSKGISLYYSPQALIKQNAIQFMITDFSEYNWSCAIDINYSPYATITENTIQNINSVNASTCGIWLMYSHYSTVTKNTVKNLYSSSPYGVNGIAANRSSDITMSGNNISNIIFSGTENRPIAGIYLSSSGVMCNNMLVCDNKISNILSNAANCIVYGIYSEAKSEYIYNNYISEIKAPISTSSNGVIGISVAGTNAYIYYNTIYLNASGSSTFGSSGIYQLNSTIADLRNNIVVNNSTPGTMSGRTVAYRWSSTYNTIFYSENSNNNCYYAGIPDTSHLIFSDGIYSDQTITTFKTRVDPRDAVSFSELPPFVNVSSSPYDLHLQTTISTQCESGGIIVSFPISIITDFDENARYPNPGYPDNPNYPATAPDVGADEFAGKPFVTGTLGNISLVPKVYQLYQNYPNPFNPTTNIKFDVPKSGLVKIKIFDLTGKLIDVLVNREIKAGSYEVKWNGTNYASGIYFYKFESVDYTKVERMVLIK